MDEFIPKLLQLESQLLSELPNFEKAIIGITKNLRQHYAGLSAPERAVGIYLLLGTTAQNPLPYALENRLYHQQPVYFDMKQYTDIQSTALLQQRLIDVVTAATPHVLLFGDIDKAPATLRGLFTALFCNAHLADTQGNIVDLTDCIFFMTTSVATHLLTGREAWTDPIKHRQIREAIYEVFAPPFIDPISLIVPFFSDSTYA